MSNEITNLSSVLTNPDQFMWKLALYLPLAERWTLQSKCTVLDPNECEPDEDEPEFARANGFRYVLSMQHVQGIVKNARLQKPTATADDLLKAFLYYNDNDAYIDFSKQVG